MSGRGSDTIVVSNRGPLTFRTAPDGSLVPVPAGGGLASSLYRLLAGSGTTWASVTMGAADREAVAQGLMTDDGLDLVPVVLDDDTYRQAYDVVANTTLWYCHHHLFDLPHRPRFDRYWREAWEGYRAYNRAVADVVAERAADGATVLVQDYHFSLLGRMLAEHRPDLRSVHFLHTPFAAPAMLGVLPDAVAAELLDGMAGYSACGFHCHKWEADFNACYAAAGRAGPRTFVAPLGPDVGVLEEEAATPECAAAAAALRAEVGDRRIVARADRMEPSKNIVRGMLAFEELLVARPEWRGPGGARGLRLPEPARAGRVSRLRGRRGAHGRADQPRLRDRRRGRLDAHPPVHGGRPDPFAGCAHPLRRPADQPRARRPQPRGQGGPLLNTADGVLVLSREAGAWEELALAGGGALGVNPFDVAGTADALHAALSMGSPERARRAGALRGAVRARTSADWWADQLAAAADTSPQD